MSKNKRTNQSVIGSSFLFPPVMLQGFRHHFVQRVGGGRSVDFVSLTDQIPVDRTNAVAENVNLQFFGGRKSSTVAVLFGNRQSGLVGIFVNKIAEGIESGGLQCAAEDL